MDGAIFERVNRRNDIEVNSALAQSSLLYSESGLMALREIYRGYFSVADKSGIPMLTLAPTWRANRERLDQAPRMYKNANQDGVKFLRNLVMEFANSTIYIGGDMGCRGDAYNPEEALSAEQAFDFHSPQISWLSEGGPDYLIATALPALSEAKGIARAMSEAELPYILSFIIRPSGALLDGTMLGSAMDQIDDLVINPPLAYLVNCVHTSTFARGIEHLSNFQMKRLLGLKANTSSRTPEELNNLNYLDTQEPVEFARSCANLAEKLNLPLFGGCCGTDDRHIEQLALQLLESRKNG